MEPSWLVILDAVTSALGKLAWPIIALVAMFRFTPELRNLLTRLRKGGGAEFDPPTQTSPLPSDPVPAPSQPGVTAVPYTRTPALKEWENSIRKLPGFAALASSVEREEFLVNSMARLILMRQFETAEFQIWASQLALLSYLASRPQGDSAETLRHLFYEPAKARNPDRYAPYPFEAYLAFLQSHALLTRVGDLVQITPAGVEYLQWRTALGRPTPPLE
jgi:hypothetical protein